MFPAGLAMIVAVACASLAPMLATPKPAVAAQRPAPLVSPEVRADHKVTFRLRMPNALKVTVGLEGTNGFPMVKDENGVWSYTTSPLTPDIYGYTFNVDGTDVLDPLNPSIKPNLLYVGNMVTVTGDSPQPWEVQNVEHGVVHHHFYHSTTIGDDRDYFVYTPPGYRPNDRTRLPVLFLFHGFSDTANGWTAVGMANVILDNLIAAGRAKPMIVVMPLGYGVPNFASRGITAFQDRNRSNRNMEDFRASLLNEIMPRIEREYHASNRREDHAVAGLSMGGAETLFVGLNNLDKFAYVGAFSSGGLPGDFKADFPSLTADAANRLKELWVSCGTEDGLIAFNRRLVGWLKGQGIHVEAVETPGRHAWMVWRRNLIAFASKLFQPTAAAQ